MVDNIGAGIGGQGFGGIMDDVGGMIGSEGEVGEWNVVKRERWRQSARNSSLVEMLSSRVREVSTLQARDPGLRTRRGSSSSLSEGKKSDDGWFLGALDRESGYKSSNQLELFNEEMVVVHEGTMPVGKLDLLLCLVLGKRQA